MERLEPLILTYARWVLTRHRYLITGLRGVGGFHSRPTPTLSGCHQFGPPCQNLTNKTARLREQCRSGAQSTRFFWIPPACFCGGFVSRYNRSQTLHTHVFLPQTLHKSPAHTRGWKTLSLAIGGYRPPRRK